MGTSVRTTGSLRYQSQISCASGHYQRRRQSARDQVQRQEPPRRLRDRRRRRSCAIGRRRRPWQARKLCHRPRTRQGLLPLKRSRPCLTCTGSALAHWCPPHQIRPAPHKGRAQQAPAHLGKGPRQRRLCRRNSGRHELLRASSTRYIPTALGSSFAELPSTNSTIAAFAPASSPPATIPTYPTRSEPSPKPSSSPASSSTRSA